MERMKIHLGGSIDMLTGPLLKKILLFSLPLMASSVLQLLFNAADVVVLGRYANYASLAAVGGTTAIVNLVGSPHSRLLLRRLRGNDRQPRRNKSVSQVRKARPSGRRRA